MQYCLVKVYGREDRSLPTHSQDANEETGKNCLKAQRCEFRSRNQPAHRVAVVQVAEVGHMPLVNRVGQQDYAYQ